jgi:ribonuclease HI
MANGLGIIDEDALNIFTDGSSFPLKKRASGVGIRFVWVNDCGDEETDDYAPPGWASATIDEVEIKAVTVGLVQAQRMFGDLAQFKKIHVFSDSRYIVDNFVRAMNVWPNRGWRGANGMPVENINLWKGLRKEVSHIPIRVELEWVKAHKSNRHNKAADKLAKDSASVPINKPFSISATTRKWSDRKTIRGCISPKGQLMRVRVISREYIRKAMIGEYRYEVIDTDDPNFKDVDFAYCETNLSRNKCYLVRLNTDASKATFVEIVEELVCADFKYV